MVPMDTNYIDFHTHILPGIDDGSPNLATSEAMLNCLKNQNVCSAVLTPHFYSDRESMQKFLDRRSLALKKLIPVANQLNMRILPACELYFTDYILNYDNLSQLCINNDRYMLVEFPFSCDFPDSMKKKLEHLISLNVIPVLAHIERYDSLMKNRMLLTKLIAIGCITQINLGSLIHGGFSQKRTLFRYIREGYVHIVGTDWHNMTTRPPEYIEGIRMIGKKVGKKAVENMMENAGKIINT